MAGGRGRERERDEEVMGGRERGWEGGGETNTQREGGTEGERERGRRKLFFLLPPARERVSSVILAILFAFPYGISISRSLS